MSFAKHLRAAISRVPPGDCFEVNTATTLKHFKSVSLKASAYAGHPLRDLSINTGLLIEFWRMNIVSKKNQTPQT